MKKIVIAIVSLSVALGLIGIGIYFKQNDGYEFKYQEDVIDVIKDDLQMSETELTYLNEKHYKKDGLHLYMIALENINNYYFYIFEEKSNQRYQKYYHFSYSKSDELKVIHDAKSQLTIACGSNEAGKIAGFEICRAGAGIRMIDDNAYIIEVFDNNDIDILPVDDQKEIVNDYTMKRTYINEGEQ